MSESDVVNGKHKSNGRFAVGNKLGTGRPRRAVESQYLAAISDACPLSTWKEIVKAAVSGALAGDAAARTWLSKYLIGDNGGTLLTIVARDLAINGTNPDLAERIERETAKLRDVHFFSASVDGEKAVELATAFANAAEPEL